MNANTDNPKPRSIIATVLKRILYTTLTFLLCIVGLFIFLGVKFGAFYKPDIPQLQADGEVLLSAIHKYREVHSRLPKERDEMLVDENISAEAKSLLLNSGWQYVNPEYHDGPSDEFFICKYTGHMGDVLIYKMNEGEYSWGIMNWK